MNFDQIKTIIDDIVDFIKRSAANLTKFINGLKNEIWVGLPE